MQQNLVNLLKNHKTKAKIKLISIAASILLLVIGGMYICIKNLDQNENDLGTFKNPNIAWIETQKQLNLISININKGYQSVAIINEFQQSKNSIFKK